MWMTVFRGGNTTYQCPDYLRIQQRLSRRQRVWHSHVRPRRGHGVNLERLLVHAERADLPVRVLESRRVLGHIVDAGTRAAAWVGVASPVAAECQIEDDVVRRKVRRNIAVRVHEQSDGLAERASVERRRSGHHSRGSQAGVSGPEPHGDGGGGAFHSVNPASIGVEGRSEGVAEARVNTASLVAVVSRHAVRRSRSAGHRAATGWHGAPSASVEGCEIRDLIVDTFDNIDLSTVRPASSGRGPESGPGTAALGHMAQVKNRKAILVDIVGLDADRVTSCSGRRQGRRVVRPHDKRVARRIREVVGEGRGLRDVGNEPIGGVSNRLPGEPGQELRADVRVRDVVGRGKGGASQAKRNSREGGDHLRESDVAGESSDLSH